MEHQLLAFITFILSSLICYIVFRPILSRHKNLPPSPFFKLPIIGHMHILSPLLHQSFDSLSRKYGPIFSVDFGSIPCVVASTPHFAKLILQTNEQAFNCRYESMAIKRLTYDASLAFSPYGDYWRFVKKLSMSELLSSRNINNFQQLRLQENHVILKLFANKAKSYEVVNVTQEFLKVTNSVISKMMLGEAEEARDVIRDVTEMFGEFNVSDFIWLFKKFDIQGLGKRIEDLFLRFDTLVERVISKREEMRKNKGIVKNKDTEAGTEFRDFLDILLDCIGNEKSEVKIERVHIKALVMDFFTAATDTTAISTEWALVELMNNPSLLQKAREEIDKVVGKNKLVDESDGPNLPYLQAIVMESYRLHPPVPMVARRCVKDCKIENYMIPKNSLIFVNTWSIGRNPKYWDNPLEFDPERFLQNSTDSYIDVRGQNFSLLPFGSGARMCPGINLTMRLVPALLGAIIQCFDFHVLDSKGDIMNGGAIDVNERPGLTAPRAHDLVCIPIERIGYHGPLETLGC